MASLKFYPSTVKPNSKIYLRLSLKRGSDFRLSTGLTITDPGTWNTGTGYPKKNTEDNKILHKALTGLESFLESKIKEIESSKTESTNDISSKWVKNLILENFNETPAIEKDLLINYTNSFVESLKNKTYKRNGRLFRYTENTISKYQNFSKQLEGFETHINKKLRIQDISNETANQFMNYLTDEKHLAINTKGRFLKRLKTILRDASINGFKVDPSYQEIKGFEDETLVTFLTFEEIDTIIEKPMPTKRLEIAKDWLIIGCYTGQRISDYFRMNKEFIKTENKVNWITFKQFKTAQRVRIPIHYKVDAVLKKYNYDFPPNFSKDEHSNRTILSLLMKEVCRISGIKQIVKGRYNGVVKNYPKWKLIQNHSTRRSFCSNFYGMEGWTTPMIMQISGHQTEKNFLKYIDQADNFYSDEAAKNFARMKEEDLKDKRKLRSIKTGTSE